MKTKIIFTSRILIVVILAWGMGYSQARGQEGMPAAPQSPQVVVTAFTYQGSLKQSGSAVDENCDFKFGLWTAQSLGTQLGVTQTLTSTVSSGLFSVQLNAASQFGAKAFDGGPRWLALALRCPAGRSSYTSLSRQELTAVPYALFSLNAGSTAKLQDIPVSSSAPTTGQMLKYDGTQWAAGGYQGLVIVAKSGGNYTTVHDALASITTASENNRYLVKVMPGVYTETVAMKQYVDIEGSGELATRITYPGGSGIYYGGTLWGANNAELRFLTVASTGGADLAYAIYNSSKSPRLTHVTARAAGGVTESRAVSNSSSSPTMTDVTASATGSGSSSNYGVYNASSSSPTMTNVSASATGSGSSYNYGVYNSSSSPTMMDVSASASGGTNSSGVYNYSSSPTMTDVIASASGGTEFSTGVLNGSSSPTMTNVSASASGGTNSSSCGVYNSFSSSPVMNNVIASASDGRTNTGVFNYSASAVIQNSVIRASGGTYNYGIYNYEGDAYAVKVNNSQVTGSTNTIYNESGFTTRVGASSLDGGAVSNGGTLTCAGVYDENYTFYASTCP